MTRQIDLSKIGVKEKAIDPILRSLELLRGLTAREVEDRQTGVVFSSIDGESCHMPKVFFDRLVYFRFVNRGPENFNIVEMDRELEKYGLIKIVERPQEMGYFQGEVVVTAAQLSVAITEKGAQFVENIDPIELAYSFIRERNYPLLEQLMPMLGNEALPVFLAHWSSRAREIALSCLEK